MTSKRLKKIFAIASAILVLCFSFFAVWQYLMPRYVVTEVLNKFEDACYTGNSGKMLELTYSKSPYYKLMKESFNNRGTTELTKEFNKFEKGFRIIKTRHCFASLPGDEPCMRELIFVYLSKIAKKDGKERYFEEVELVKISGEWKISRYYFPDFIDY